MKKQTWKLFRNFQNYAHEVNSCSIIQKTFGKFRIEFSNETDFTRSLVQNLTIPFSKKEIPAIAESLKKAGWVLTD